MPLDDINKPPDDNTIAPHFFWCFFRHRNLHLRTVGKLFSIDLERLATRIAHLWSGIRDALLQHWLKGSEVWLQLLAGKISNTGGHNADAGDPERLVVGRKSLTGLWEGGHTTCIHYAVQCFERACDHDLVSSRANFEERACKQVGKVHAKVTAHGGGQLLDQLARRSRQASSLREQLKKGRWRRIWLDEVSCQGEIEIK